MRDLKTLLELLLENWELSHDFENLNIYKGFCDSSLYMKLNGVISSEEEKVIDTFILKHTDCEEGRFYLFGRYLHNQRVKWLKERIKELEK